MGECGGGGRAVGEWRSEERWESGEVKPYSNGTPPKDQNIDFFFF